MNGHLKAALCAAAAMCATNAHAATYVEYEIDAVGGGSIIECRLYQPICDLQSIAAYNFTFVTPTDKINGDIFSANGSIFPFGGGVASVGSTADRITLSNRLIDGKSFAASLCVPAGPNCGSVSFALSGARGEDYISFNGSVERYRVRTFTTDSDVAVGLTRATPGVPEPSTWALMLAGFVMVGAAMRRRAQAAFA